MAHAGLNSNDSSTQSSPSHPVTLQPSLTICPVCLGSSIIVGPGVGDEGGGRRAGVNMGFRAKYPTTEMAPKITTIKIGAMP